MGFKEITSVVITAIDKRLPEILTGVGVASMCVGTVLACKETPKALQIIEASKSNLKAVEDTAEVAKANGGVIIKHDGTKIEYSEQDHKKDVMIVKTTTGKGLIKTYLPAGLCMLGGILSIGSGMGILRNRYTSCAVAAAALEEGFRRYRSNVVDALGEEQDKTFRFGGKTETVTETSMDEEGNEVENVREVETYTEKHEEDPRVFLFNAETSPIFTGNLLYDLNTAKAAQHASNERLTVFGNCNVNYAREEFGGVDIPEGIDHGWVKDGPGDGHVDFGIFDADGQPKQWVVKYYGEHQEIPIEFNIDGNIKSFLRRPRNAQNK